MENAPSAPIAGRPATPEAPLPAPVIPTAHDKPDIPPPQENRETKPDTTSPRLMWHVVQGDFETNHFDPTKTADKVSDTSYDALQAQHDATRQVDATLRKAVIREMYKDTKTPEEIERIIHHEEMKLWGGKEAKSILTVIREDVAAVPALEKLGFDFKDGITAENIQKALYDVDSANDTGTYGVFYEKYCRRGKDMNRLLAQDLSLQDIDAIQPFLEDVLGDPRAFKALRAIRETQDMLDKTKGNAKLQQDAYTYNSGLRAEENPTLNYFKEGAALAKEKAEEAALAPRVQPEQPSPEPLSSASDETQILTEIHEEKEKRQLIQQVEPILTKMASAPLQQTLGKGIDRAINSPHLELSDDELNTLKTFVNKGLEELNENPQIQAIDTIKEQLLREPIGFGLRSPYEQVKEDPSVTVPTRYNQPKPHIAVPPETYLLWKMLVPSESESHGPTQNMNTNWEGRPAKQVAENYQGLLEYYKSTLPHDHEKPSSTEIHPADALAITPDVAEKVLDQFISDDVNFTDKKGMENLIGFITVDGIDYVVKTPNQPLSEGRIAALKIGLENKMKLMKDHGYYDFVPVEIIERTIEGNPEVFLIQRELKQPGQTTEDLNAGIFRNPLPKEEIQRELQAKGLDIVDMKGNYLPYTDPVTNETRWVVIDFPMVHEVYQESIGQTSSPTREKITELANQAEIKSKAAKNRAEQDATGFGPGTFGVSTETQALMRAVGKISRDENDIGEHFKAHGIGKGTTIDQLQALVNILHGQSAIADSFAVSLGSSNTNYPVYGDSGFMLIGPKDQRLIKDDKTFNINLVAVNSEFYDAIPTLQQWFPGVNFVKAENLPDVLKKQVEESTIQTSLENSSAGLVSAAKREIFERAGKRSPEEVQQLIDEVKGLLMQEKERGKGKMRATVQEMNDSTDIDQGKPTREGEVVFLPKGAGRVVALGDIHGDLATIQQVLTKEHILEDLAVGKPVQVVFMGDLVDRGPKDIEVMEAVMMLKKLYPDNITIMKADHETAGGITDHDFPSHLQNKFGQEAGTTLNRDYIDLFYSLPRFVAGANGLDIVHGGPSSQLLNLQELATLAPEEVRHIMDSEITWADPADGRKADNLRTQREEMVRDLQDQINNNSTIPYFEPPSNPARGASGAPALTTIEQKKHLLHLLTTLPPGFYPHPERSSQGTVLSALAESNLYYTGEAVTASTQETGSTVMLRAHQTSEQAGENAIKFDGKLGSIHTTGEGSPESAYSGGEPHPRYAVFDLEKPITQISPDNIKDVWATEITSPTSSPNPATPEGTRIIQPSLESTIQTQQKGQSSKPIQGVDEVFGAMGAGFEQQANMKEREYAQRILAVRQGEELVKGDLQDPSSLYASYKRSVMMNFYSEYNVLSPDWIDPKFINPNALSQSPSPIKKMRSIFEKVRNGIENQEPPNGMQSITFPFSPAVFNALFIDAKDGPITIEEVKDSQGRKIGTRLNRGLTLKETTKLDEVIGNEGKMWKTASIGNMIYVDYELEPSKGYHQRMEQLEHKSMISQIRQLADSLQNQSGRLGRDILLGDSHIAAAQKFVKETSEELAKSTQLHVLDKMIKDLARINQGFLTRVQFGDPFIVNAAIDKPRIGKDSKGTTIELPPSLYILMKANNNNHMAQRALNDYIAFMQASEDERHNMGVISPHNLSGCLKTILAYYRLLHDNLSPKEQQQLAESLKTPSSRPLVPQHIQPKRTFQG